MTNKDFRRTSDHTTKTADADMKASLAKVTLDTVNKTVCKAQSYMAAYTDISGESYSLIGKHVKLKKCNHNILDIKTKLHDKLLNQIDIHAKKVDVEKKLIAKRRN